MDGDSKELLITNVLYVPDMGINLFSIGAATDNEMVATFADKSCIIRQHGKVILTGGRASDAMYHLHIRPTLSANLAQRAVSLTTWHNRCGHADSRNLLRVSNNNLVEGLVIDCKKLSEGSVCGGCASGKMHRISYKESTSAKADSIAGRIHSDVCGPMPVTSLGGARYFIIFKDEFSGWITTNFMKTKTEVLHYLKSLHAFYKTQTGCQMKIYRTDQGTEACNDAITNWTLENGILHETSAPYTPEQDGKAERTIRTIMEMARCMMTSAKAPTFLWGEATAYSTFIRNRIPTGKSTQSPYEIIKKRKPDVSLIRIFGSKVYFHIPDVKRKKLDAKCKEGVLVGFCELTKAYRVFIPATGKVEVSLNVLIDETKIGFDGFGRESTHCTADPFIHLIDEFPVPIDNNNNAQHMQPIDQVRNTSYSLHQVNMQLKHPLVCF